MIVAPAECVSKLRVDSILAGQRFPRADQRLPKTKRGSSITELPREGQRESVTSCSPVMEPAWRPASWSALHRASSSLGLFLQQVLSG